jgi:hypothetical protein
VGACEAAPLRDASFDLITSFETIEHHDKHDEMLVEIKRMLKPNGILILSSPNKLTYSDRPGYHNPFHVKELYFDDLKTLLERHFKHVRFYGQRLASGSFIHPLVHGTNNVWNAWSGRAGALKPQVCALESPIYFVAICGDSSEIDDREIASVYVDRLDDLTAKGNTDVIASSLDEAYALEGSSEDNLASDLLRARAAQLRASAIAQANHALALRQSAGIANALTRHARQLRERQERISRISEMAEAEMARSRAAEREAAQQQLRLSDTQLQLSRQSEAIEWLYKSRSWRIASALLRISGWRRNLRRLFRGTVFRGVLDFPQPTDTVSDWLEIRGWVYSKRARITGVQLFIGDMFLGNLAFGLDRPDVAAAFPREAPLACGYHERISLKGLNVRGKLLKIWAHDASGNSECFTGEIRLAPSESVEQKPNTLTAYLNCPCPGETVAEEIAIAGWAYSRTAPVTLVEATIGNFRTSKMKYGVSRPDVLMQIAEAPLECGFHGALSLAGLASGEQRLTVRIVDADGKVQLLHRVVTVMPHLAQIVRGALDFPMHGVIDGNFIEIVGWAHSAAGAITSVDAWIDELYLGNLRYGTNRLDVTAIMPEVPIACGFKERILLNGLSMYGQRVLRVQAYDEHGNEVCFTQLITLRKPQPTAFTDFGRESTTAVGPASARTAEPRRQKFLRPDL